MVVQIWKQSPSDNYCRRGSVFVDRQLAVVSDGLTTLLLFSQGVASPRALCSCMRTDPFPSSKTATTLPQCGPGQRIAGGPFCGVLKTSSSSLLMRTTLAD